MRGSIYYQTAQLTKVIFKEGVSKVERVDEESENYKCVTSYSTMQSYRRIWNNFGKYLREVWNIKNFEKIEAKHIKDYLEAKILDGSSKQYIEKINAAFSKLEIALQRFNTKNSKTKITYSFETKNIIVSQYKKDGTLASNYHNRAYDFPERLIESFENSLHKLAASIQLEGGARFKGVRRIKMNQLKGYKLDKVTGKIVGVIETKEKGGRVGEIMIGINTYIILEAIIKQAGEFNIDYEQYAADFRKVCTINNIECHGSHGMRWNFAKNRLVEYQDSGYSYDQALLSVSKNLKHNRKIIAETYLG
ncbi:MAG: hypothetical protein DRG78_15175 [Epsilonproteobacteria bacterium]|nr:MAG: hypothetical protein DRG78_15175 [Campylobacterota bacterium]